MTPSSSGDRTQTDEPAAAPHASDPRARRARWRPIAIALAAALLVGALGGTVTDTGEWYQALEKPVWQPPDWLFGPVWTAIYAFAAAAAVIGWRNARGRVERDWVVILFTLNGFLNVLWSLLFFRLQRPDWALFEVAFLWASVLLLIVFLARFNRLAAGLLAPYILWVSFAAALNGAIVALNAPFGG